ncbi:MAG: N(4)-(beta-N-acetylglucosaminyl)-L-asparaginase [Phycisphaerae bacterium]|nr:N(4)-(beta-N-acetylglucosaminyl)-L-asparaginase [Phycisphaerae bacterium]
MIRTNRAPSPSRREFLAAAAAAPLGPAALAALATAAPNPGMTVRTRVGTGPISIASGNGLRACTRAVELLKQGADPADAIVQGVAIIENDPEDQSVGLGGLPNEEGVVQLDASVMYGPTHKAGAVAAIENIKNPAAVALLVLRRTNHVLLVGAGALKFARLHGFQEENLLTEKSRKAWLKWKENLSPRDDWLDDEQRDPTVGKAADPLAAVTPMHTTGTVHCSALTAGGDLASCTSTSGLSWKIPGRVGDSPIIGAGNYCDNAVGAGGCTGRGESCIVNCAAFSIVSKMESGMEPTDACVAVAKRIAAHTLEIRRRAKDGRPDFDVSLYALRKDGAYGGACLFPGGTFAVHDGTAGRTLPCTPLFEKN